MEQEYYSRLIQLEARVHRIEAMMEAMLVRLGIDSAEFTPREPPEMEAIREMVLLGRKINAIKLYRELYGVGLKEAKDAVDAMERKLRG